MFKQIKMGVPNLLGGASGKDPKKRLVLEYYLPLSAIFIKQS